MRTRCLSPSLVLQLQARDAAWCRVAVDDEDAMTIMSAELLSFTAEQLNDIAHGWSRWHHARLFHGSESILRYDNVRSWSRTTRCVP